MELEKYLKDPRTSYFAGEYQKTLEEIKNLEKLFSDKTESAEDLVNEERSVLEKN